MAAFLGISLWITLATVVPGLVTIALVYSAFLMVSPGHHPPFHEEFANLNDWILAGIALTVMVMTQLVGILVERMFMRHHWLGPERRLVKIPAGIDPLHITRFTLLPYAEYGGLYLLLAELREYEDSQGHLQRVIAQFFLTNNLLVSFLAGIAASVVALVTPQGPTRVPGLLFLAALLVSLGVIYSVARIRFEVMAKALWAARRRRLQEFARQAASHSTRRKSRLRRWLEPAPASATPEVAREH